MIYEKWKLAIHNHDDERFPKELAAPLLQIALVFRFQASEFEDDDEM